MARVAGEVGGRPRWSAHVLWVALLTAAYMVAIGGFMPVVNDSSRDMLLGRDGWAHGVFTGCQTSFPGIQHGSLWVRLLAGTYAVGLGAVGQQLIGLVLTVLSVCAFDWGVRRHFGEGIGWLAVGVFVPLIIVAISYPIATNGYLGPPVLVASTLALLYVATSGSTLAACVCGGSLALAAELHPVTLLSLPVFVCVVSMSCERPVRALLLSVVTGVGLAMTLSPDSWLHNARTIVHQRWSMVLVATVLVLACVVSGAGRRRWRALAIDQRRLLVLVAIVSSVVMQVVAASVATGRVLSNGSGFMFPVPALVILVALGLRRWRAFSALGRLGAIGIPVLLLSARALVTAVWWSGVATGTVSAPTYSMREAESLARYFWAIGYTFPDVQRHLRGPQGFELVNAIAAFAPSAEGPLERPLRDVRVVTFSKRNQPDAAIPEGGMAVDLRFGRLAWILPLEAWVRVAPSRACFEPWTAAGAGNCVDIVAESIAYTGWYRDLHERPLPALREARTRRSSPPHGPRFKWELPIEITGDDPERHFELVGLIATPWVIERVEDVAYRGELPGRHVVLERGGKLSGRIVLAPLPSDMTLKDYPPDFLETRPGEEALRRSLQRLPPLGRFICETVGSCPDRGPGGPV